MQPFLTWARKIKSRRKSRRQTSGSQSTSEQAPPQQGPSSSGIMPPFPSVTPTWHNDTYSAISPSREALSQSGKTVIITGAGGTIGRRIASAFSEANAKHVVLVGRTEASLAETKSLIKGKSHVSVHVADVCDTKSMTKVAETVGTWDVFIMNAGYISTPSPIDRADLDDYWRSYEVNVRSIVIAAKAFMPTANKHRAVVIGNTAGGMMVGPKMAPGLSAYLCSKLAQVRTLEYLAEEHPHLFVASAQPGIIDSPIFRASGATPEMLPMDTPTLAAHFMVWLSSEEAAFLKGRFVFSNWDVNELKDRANEIKNGNSMTISFGGWPYEFGPSQG